MPEFTSNKPNRLLPEQMSESELLAAEKAAAKEDISATLERMRDDLAASADVAAWTRKYPWASVGAAAGIGFLAATLMNSRKSRDHVTEALNQALNAKQEPEPKPGIVSSLLSELVKALAMGIQAALTATLAAYAQQSTPPEPSTNGHAAPTDVTDDDLSGLNN